jgi:Raf kinase inhibitor-like YbhB/YbcL family protein
MRILSSAFGMDQPIPTQYTCDGRDVNPPLSIEDVPAQAKSMVLIVDDPYVPAKTWVHWILWNLDPNTREIPADSVPKGAMQGINDFGKREYGGPCPPGDIHRYYFRLFALDAKLTLPADARLVALEDAMRGKILAQAECVGTYTR